MLPIKIHRYANGLLGLVGEKQITIFLTVQIKILGDLNIFFAVIDDFPYPPLFPPSKGLKSVRRLFLAQGYAGKMIQRESVTELIVFITPWIVGQEPVLSLDEQEALEQTKFEKPQPSETRAEQRIAQEEE